MGEAIDPASAPGGVPSKVGEFQDLFAKAQGARYGIACASGTAAIEVVLKTPEWMKLGPPEPLTIEHEPNADTEASD